MRRKIIYLLFATVCLVTMLTSSYIYRKQSLDIDEFTRAAASYYGSRGQEVLQIQTKLSNWGYYYGDIDGIYGYQTYQAVRYFQSKNGLDVDGVAGPQTLQALGIYAGGNNNYGTTSRDEDLLAHIIYGEARGEPYIGQVAVAAVILNRIRDGRFPTTIAGVIYQPGAFDAVSDGQINLQPDNTAYRAARDALNGWDPTYGCIYYYNPATATSQWIWSRPIILSIGRHNFAR